MTTTTTMIEAPKTEPRPVEADDPGRFRIYWTTGAEADLALELVASGRVPAPDGLVRAIRSRRGRAGRGRLWRLEELNVEAPADRWPSVVSCPVAAFIQDYACGGIVVHQCLLDVVRRLPGFVTDLDLRIA